MKPRGRPRMEHPKSYQYCISITEENADKLHTLANEYKVSIAYLIREGIQLMLNKYEEEE